MAIIGKIRKRSTLLLVFVGVALAAFIIGDDFIRNLGGGSTHDMELLANINGEKVKQKDFAFKMEQAIEGFKQQQGKEAVSNEENFQIMSQVWEQIKKETILEQQCLLLGLVMENGFDPKPSISAKEYYDLIQGTYPHQLITQNFSDPQTGKFDPKSVENFLNSVESGKKSQKPEEVEQAIKSETQWKNLEEYIKKDRLVEKYNNLIAKSYYLPKTLAEQDHKEKNTVLGIRFFGIRYNTISDSAAIPTDADYQAYYDLHKEEFKTKEETRNVDFVVWNVKPSAEDIKVIEEEVAVLKNEFNTVDAESMGSFIVRNSNSRFDTNWVAKGKLPVYIDSIAFNAPTGTVFGPWVEKEAYHLAKLMDVQARPDSMKASHILISYAGSAVNAKEVTRTKIQAKQIADSLYKVITKNPNAFEENAGTISDDATAKAKQGDLDWFADGNMVPEFNDACIKGKVGEFVQIETPFGFHIIKITGKKEPIKKVKVAIIDKEIIFSQQTYEKIYSEANSFLSSTKDTASFDKNTTDKGLQVNHNPEVKIMDLGLQGIPGTRDAVQWVFDEKREVGEVSNLFAYDDKLVVAVLRKVKEKGIPELADIKDYIKPLVIREVKAKKLLAMHKNIGTDINALAAKNNATIDTFPNYTFAGGSLPTYGPEPSFQGKIMALDKNKLYGPFKGDQGIYFVIVDTKTEAQKSTDNYMMNRMQAQAMFGQRVSGYMDKYGEAYRALEEKSEIEDFRQFFY